MFDLAVAFGVQTHQSTLRWNMARVTLSVTITPVIRAYLNDGQGDLVDLGDCPSYLHL
jgi:hypothetical protein